jgi:hypothetical protein
MSCAGIEERKKEKKRGSLTPDQQLKFFRLMDFTNKSVKVEVVCVESINAKHLT